MTRVEGWDGRLHKAVEAFRGAPFAWGTNDCLCGLAARAVEAVTGVDPAAQYRGTYSDAVGALKVLKSLGAESAAQLIASRYVEIPKGKAQRGDLAIILEPSADEPMGAVGVVLGAIVAGYHVKGLSFVGLDSVSRVFKVE